jgi:fructokinase
MGRMIVVAGEALIDILVQPDGRLTAVPGGGPFNTARTIGRLGGQVAFLGRLSTDRFGGILRDGLTESGVDLSLAEATDAPTTLAIAELDDAGAASYRFHTTDTSAAALSADAVEAALARRPRAVHLGTLGLALEPVADVLAAAIPAIGVETLVMLDPNCRPRVIRERAAYLDRLDRIMTRADVVKVSIDDLAYLAPDRSPTHAAQAFLDRGVSVVLVTDGPGPVLIVAATGVSQLPTPAVSIVDTVGAGDAFGGGFLARWSERGSGREDLADSEGVRDAVAFAIAVAVRTCQRAGADPPRRADLPRAAA